MTSHEDGVQTDIGAFCILCILTYTISYEIKVSAVISERKIFAKSPKKLLNRPIRGASTSSGLATNWTARAAQLKCQPACQLQSSMQHIHAQSNQIVLVELSQSARASQEESHSARVCGGIDLGPRLLGYCTEPGPTQSTKLVAPHLHRA